jgi:FkbM family methyltransferase
MNQEVNSPKPTKLNVLSRLKASVPITSVVDVGVRECTGELMLAFPDLKHHLFEPVNLFFDLIEKNYRNIDHELHPFALSDEDTQIYLLLTALNKDGVATHSRIVKETIEADGRDVVSCSVVQVRRFDSFARERSIAKNFLLKVDVDGKDLEVVKGFGAYLADASAVVIECTYASFIQRVSYLSSQGFSLVDIVDVIYYGDSVYQFDAVMVRNDLITAQLRPPIGNFRRELWQPAPEQDKA